LNNTLQVRDITKTSSYQNLGEILKK